jgi:hypothetical protein
VADDEAVAAQPFAGLTHDQVLDLDFPNVRELVRDLVPAGAVGTIAGVPETYKSWLAQAIAVRVAAGAGSVLGCDVVQAARVGYFWQDDSTREEAERVKLFETVHESSPWLSLVWFLNQDVALPGDLERLRATIEELKLELVVLDSFYNFLPGADLKADDAERVVALIKREISDKTGATVLVVDHMPWATETNRQRLRAYGGVFKNAATRFGIYIEANGNKLSIEARGNNIRGFKKRAAYWDEQALELRLIDATDHDEHVERCAEKLLAHLTEHPGSHTTTALAKTLSVRDDTVKDAGELLKARAVVFDHGRDGGPWSGKNGAARYWIAAIHAASHGIDTTAQLFGPRSAEVNGWASEDAPRPGPSIRAVVDRAVVEDEIERLAATNADTADDA